MFDIGWSEILVVVIITILVVGPKELPGLLRTIGKTVGNLRRMAGDFQHQFNDALKEAELDEVQKTIGDVRTLDPGTALKDAVKKQLSSVDDLTEDLSAQMASSKRDINEALETGSASAPAPAIDDRSMVPPELEQLHRDANIVSDADAQSQPDMGKTKKAD
ncbi:MAG: Sec-independent protein translocase protein TatB [Cohaesibacter sp.]|nr:Sec-independent protein translocase protein TatB [Cohaesibacter sp.]